MSPRTTVPVASVTETNSTSSSRVELSVPLGSTSCWSPFFWSCWRTVCWLAFAVASGCLALEARLVVCPDLTAVCSEVTALAASSGRTSPKPGSTWLEELAKAVWGSCSCLSGSCLFPSSSFSVQCVGLVEWTSCIRCLSTVSSALESWSKGCPSCASPCWSWSLDPGSCGSWASSSLAIDP